MLQRFYGHGTRSRIPLTIECESRKTVRIPTKFVKYPHLRYETSMGPFCFKRPFIYAYEMKNI